MAGVKRLFSKILLAQAITVVLALVVVLLITRVNLQRGFMDFLEQQEAAVLSQLAPALAELYEARGSWDFLQDQPANWDRILHQNRPRDGTRSGVGRPATPWRGQRTLDPGWQPPEGHMLQRLGNRDRLNLRERLFLLDREGNRIAGAVGGEALRETLEAIVVGDETVGLIGFVPAAGNLPPEAQRFLARQWEIMTLSLVLALLLAAAPALLLARHLTRPVRQLDRAVTLMTQGDYDARTGVTSRDEIGRLARNVNRLAEALERNRTAQRRWMADIAHELRTPISILKGEIEAAIDGVRPPDQRMLQSVAEEVEQLSTLVDDLQALALADAGALNIRKEAVDLGELAQQARTAFQQRLDARGISLTVATTGDVSVMADPQRIRQLLHNLLDNGSKYVEERGRMRLSLTRVDDRVELALDDSGPGVSDQQRERLFDRFYRVEQSRARSTGGSGLGLAICKNIVEAHGGEIRAGQSELGGLCIRLSLPD
jgi:two-component system sensor histidine kinase BaeS